MTKYSLIFLNIYYIIYFFYRPQIFLSLTLCLKDEDANVRKGASYAIGNATFHSGELYEVFKPSISELLSILDDPVAKTRANAAG